MKIAYIELDTHAEIASNFYELLKDSEVIKTDFYCSEKILKRLNWKVNSNIFLSSTDSILLQIQNKNYDLIIIGTAHRYFHVFKKIVANFPTAIVVHNLNFSKISKKSLFQNIWKKEVLYRIKLLQKESLLSVPDVYENAKAHFVLDKNLAQNKIQFLPIFYNKFNSNSKENVLTIVIPGSVSQHRRDYKSVLQNISTFKNPVRIVFLGKAENEELKWLQDFEKSKTNQVEIIYFKEKIPQNLFDEWMKKAHFLWCPIQKETEFFSVKEIYGETKLSGNIGDCINYGKMGVFPKNFKSEFGFVIAEEDYLEQQFHELRLKSFDFQQEFSKEKIQTQLEETLLKFK